MDFKSPKTWAVIALLIAVVYFGRFVALDASNPSLPPSSSSLSPGLSQRAEFNLFPLDNQKSVPDWTLYSPDGSTIKLSKAAKNGPVVIDLWALYCGPCRMELPVLDSIRKKYESRGVHFYGLNVADGPVSIKTYSHEAKLNLPMLYDPTHEIDRDINTDLIPDSNAIPITLVISKNLRLMTYCIGFDPNMESDLPAALDETIGLQK